MAPFQKFVHNIFGCRKSSERRQKYADVGRFYLSGSRGKGGNEALERPTADDADLFQSPLESSRLLVGCVQTLQGKPKWRTP